MDTLPQGGEYYSRRAQIFEQAGKNLILLQKPQVFQLFRLGIGLSRL
jgi:hypothetical protein